MKTTSYIILGLLGAGAVAATGLGVYTALNINGHDDPESAVVVGGDVSTMDVKPFGVLSTEVTTVVNPYGVNFVSELQLHVVQDSTLEVPRVSMSSDWTDYLTIGNSDGELSLNFDFHSLFKEAEEAAEEYRGRLEIIRNVTPSPIEIRVPAGMLRDVNANEYIRYTFEDIRTDSLRFDMLTSMTFVRCDIHHVNVSGGVKCMSIDDSWGGGHWDYETTDLTVSLKNSEIEDFTTNIPQFTVNVRGETSKVGLWRWNDTSDSANNGAMMIMDPDCVGRFEWNSPTFHNRVTYQFDSVGHLTLTAGS